MATDEVSSGSVDWTRPALVVVAAWIALALTLSLGLGVDWPAVGDFDDRTILRYHALMVPLLVMVYLLVVETLEVSGLRKPLYGGAAVVAVALAGPAGLFIRPGRLSLGTLVQVAGMTLTDILGVVLIASLVRTAFRRKVRASAALWLVVGSLAAVLLAAPFGHLAGWGVDLGLASFPGVPAWARAAGMSLEGFQEGLVGSHSHLIVAATLSGLVALAAVVLGYESAQGGKKTMSRVGAVVALVGLAAAAALYVVSALVGWNPPAVFVSGLHRENGMPLDDVILVLTGVGWVLLLMGAATAPAGLRRGVDSGVKAAMVLNVLFGFVAAVGVGVYIEFHETFFGGGELPAPGALHDQAYIRAHMVYAFMLLPMVLAFLLAQRPAGRGRPWSRWCAGLALVGMTLGLLGELVWVGALHSSVFVASLYVTDAALIVGVLGAAGVNRAASCSGDHGGGSPP